MSSKLAEIYRRYRPEKSYIDLTYVEQKQLRQYFSKHLEVQDSVVVKDPSWLARKLRTIKSEFNKKCNISEDHSSNILYNSSLYNLRGDSIYIVGTNRYCNIRFEANISAISRIHAIIIPLPSYSLILDISAEGGVFLNNIGKSFTKYNELNVKRSYSYFRKVFVLPHDLSSTIRIGYYPITFGIHSCTVCSKNNQKSTSCTFHYICLECYKDEKDCKYCNDTYEAFANPPKGVIRRDISQERSERISKF